MSHRHWGVSVIVSALLLSGLVNSVHAQAPAAKTAQVTVLLPLDEAELTINGSATKQTGLKRVFTSPPLEGTGKHLYTFKAILEPNNYTKINRTYQIDLKPGDDITVDMRTEDARWKDDVKVRYVPTPVAVVEKMMEMAKVGKDDVVYDLGCGDGRLVVTAVAKFGAKRGVGVDIDPERISDSNKNAKEHNVADKVSFKIEDVQKIKDMSDASVVLLYMGDDLNLVLRPVLQKTLKPGSRIVSHRFLMGDWMPDQTVTMEATDDWGQRDTYLIHLWTIK